MLIRLSVEKRDSTTAALALLSSCWAEQVIAWLSLTLEKSRVASSSSGHPASVSLNVTFQTHQKDYSGEKMHIVACKKG